VTSRTAPERVPQIPPALIGLSVVLYVWGASARDRQGAELDADKDAGSYRWDVHEVVGWTGGRCPLPRRDRVAVASGASYGRAWAVYTLRGAETTWALLPDEVRDNAQRVRC
jgi:hypothetical protein